MVQQTKPASQWLWIAGVAVGALLLVGVSVIATRSVMLRGATHIQAAGTPTATPDQAITLRAWRSALTPSLDEITAAMDNLQAACSQQQDMARCQLAYGRVAAAAKVAERTMDTHAAPECMATTAAEMRQAMGLMDTAGAAMAQSTSLRELLAGATTMQDATEHMRLAGQAAQSASCA